MKLTKFTSLLLFFLGKSVMAQQYDLVQYVNTLQGTNSKHELTRGNTYPTTALPFAMHTWTPQTGKNGDGWKYQYFKDKLRGFQQAHQCSSWSNDYAFFSFFPTLDSLQVDEDKRATGFSHDDEVAKPNYYSVKMANEVRAEIAPSERGAHLRFSFPKGHKGFLVVDGYTGLSMVKILPKECKIVGYVNNGKGFKEGFKNFFVAQFDQPFETFGTWENKENTIRPDSLQALGKGEGAYLSFKPGAKVQVKVASSYISFEQAELNLNRELGKDKNLEFTKMKAEKVWNDHLSRILVEGGSEEDKAIFVIQ